MAKKELKCENCQFYCQYNCHHKSNIGIKIRYRREEQFFVNEVKDIEKNCKNYKENGI